MSDFGIEWQWYQLMGMYETLIIIEADSGWMTIWNDPYTVYYKSHVLSGSILAVEKVYG